MTTKKMNELHKLTREQKDKLMGSAIGKALYYEHQRILHINLARYLYKDMTGKTLD